MIRKVLMLLGWDYLPESTIVENARTFCLENELPWQEPLAVERLPVTTVIRTNASMKGGNVIISLHARTGRVLKAQFMAR